MILLIRTSPSQVTAETTSNTGRAEHPTVTQKVPQKFFHQMDPDEEEEEERAVTLPPLLLQQQYQLLKEGLGIRKGGWHWFKLSQKCHADLIKGEADAPPPLKKRTISSTASAEKGEETVVPHVNENPQRYPPKCRKQLLQLHQPLPDQHPLMKLCLLIDCLPQVTQLNPHPENVKLIVLPSPAILLDLKALRRQGAPKEVH